MSDRLDALLERALAGHPLPADVTAEERLELERLLAAADVARASVTAIEAELEAARPAARARFERFLEAETRPRPAPSIARRRWEGWFGMPRLAGAAGLAAVLILVAAGALFLSRGAFDGPESALAAVLEPQSYAEVQGVVTAIEGEGANRVLRVQSALGEVDVAFDQETSVVAAGEAVEASAIVPGAEVLVGGVVTPERSITARTLAIHAARAEVPESIRARELPAGRGPVEGVVIVFQLLPSGERARVVIRGEQGTFVATVGPRAVRELLSVEGGPLGASIELRPDAPGTGLFLLRLLRATADPSAPGATPQATPATRDGLVRISGTILERRATVLRVRTPAGRIATVVITRHTRVLLGESGLTLTDFRAGETIIGHTVVVSGGIAEGGRINADVLLIGPKPE